MTNQNIFDISDLSDIPNELRESIAGKKNDTIKAMIVDVLGMSESSLQASQIVVAIYRKFNRAVKKKTIMIVLHNMTSEKNPIIKKVSRGYYALSNDN